MIKSFYLFAFLFTNLLFAQTGAIKNTHGYESEQVIRVFHQKNDFRYMLELASAQKLENQDPLNITIGFKYRLLSFLKLGLYYTRSYGERYEEDWIKPAGSNWQWEDTKKRGENHYTLEVSPRYQFSTNLVGEFRTRFVYNDFNSNQSLKLRPGLTYFLFKNGNPWLNLYFHHERYLSLNFSKNDIYESWYYLGSQYYLQKNILIGPYLATRKTKWASTKSQEKILGTDYNSELNGYLIGLVLNFYY